MASGTPRAPLGRNKSSETKNKWQGWVPPQGKGWTVLCGHCSWRLTSHGVCEVTEVMEAGLGTYYHRPSVRSIIRSHEGASCSREEAEKWLELSIKGVIPGRERDARLAQGSSFRQWPPAARVWTEGSTHGELGPCRKPGAGRKGDSPSREQDRRVQGLLGLPEGSRQTAWTPVD